MRYRLRTLRGLTALAGIVLPLASACALMIAIVSMRRETSTQSLTPNPSPAPWYFLGPAELLTYLDPWFAGTIAFWIYPWLAILVAFLVWSVVWLPAAGSRAQGKQRKLPVVSSLTLGCVFAAPWWYALAKILLHG
jgi:hypothetical protein